MGSRFFDHKLKAETPRLIGRLAGGRKRVLFVAAVLVALVCAGTVAAGVIFALKWGSEGAGDGQFDGPLGVAVDASYNVYVADTFNHRIRVVYP